MIFFKDIFSILLVFSLSDISNIAASSEVGAMRVCVVGAGPSGLVAGRYLEEAGFQYDIFEMTDAIGGAWVYTTSATDKYGHPANSNMYQNLRTNLPKDVMEFEDLSYKMQNSFLPSSDVLSYLLEYVEKFNLTRNIKLGHEVQNIKLAEGDKWIVQYKDLERKDFKTAVYDAVIICNGHHNVPRLPQIEGQSTFEGIAIHSKKYRVPDTFKGMNVLIIGFGPSGQDIAIDVSSAAKKVFLSHHSTEFFKDVFPENVISKPDVKSFNKTSIKFIDESVEKVDAIIYCTGYHFSYPFLDESCGITCEDNYVRPLFKHFINIQHPTMSFLCLPFRTYLMPLMEMQAKIFIKFLKDRSVLPSEEEMLQDLDTFEKSMQDKPKRKYHIVSNGADYLDSLSQMGGVKPIPPVVDKIYQHNRIHRHQNVSDYRNYLYIRVDDNEYNVIYKNNESLS